MFCFIQDSASYWYKIPVKMREEFFDYLEANDNDKLAEVFHKYRSLYPGNYMFPEVLVLKESK